jgi:2-hydroxychromene-2-carboxylate isomerase
MYWLSSGWAYLGGARFVQLAARHGLKINHIPMRMQDVYAGSGGILLANRSWQRKAYRITELKRWRSRLGMPVNIEPKFFPADVDLASCVVIAGQQRGLPVADFRCFVIDVGGAMSEYGVPLAQEHLCKYRSGWRQMTAGNLRILRR